MPQLLDFPASQLPEDELADILSKRASYDDSTFASAVLGSEELVEACATEADARDVKDADHHLSVLTLHHVTVGFLLGCVIA